MMVRPFAKKKGHPGLLHHVTEGAFLIVDDWVLEACLFHLGSLEFNLPEAFQPHCSVLQTSYLLTVFF